MLALSSDKSLITATQKSTVSLWSLHTMRMNDKKNEDSEKWTSSFSFQSHLHFFRRMHINSLFGRKSFDCHKDNIAFSLVSFRFTRAQWAVRVLSFSKVFTGTSHEEVPHNPGEQRSTSRRYYMIWTHRAETWRCSTGKLAHACMRKNWRSRRRNWGRGESWGIPQFRQLRLNTKRRSTDRNAGVSSSCNKSCGDYFFNYFI